WYINGTEVDSKTDYRYSFIDGDLIITNASEITDNGKYQCQVENSYGIILSREVLLHFACWCCCLFICICVAA
ncbi:Contactin-5, partial [Xenoophorus captivus]